MSTFLRLLVVQNKPFEYVTFTSRNVMIMLIKLIKWVKMHLNTYIDLFIAIKRPQVRITTYIVL